MCMHDGAVLQGVMQVLQINLGKCVCLVCMITRASLFVTQAVPEGLKGAVGCPGSHWRGLSISPDLSSVQPEPRSGGPSSTRYS